MAISASDFNYIAELARSQAAIVLEPGKEYLVENRLGILAQREGYPTLDAFIGKMRSEKLVNGIHLKTVDALTTNETLFFRDFHPFEAMRKVILPKFIVERGFSKHLNIWSAACSSGQEPYSLAMLIRQHFPQMHDWRINILATDLSPTVLKLAGEGSYSQFEVNRGLPAAYLIKYFDKQNDRWVIKDEIKKMVQFRTMNFVQPWPLMPPFDLVFIRNVMIYFDVETKKFILKKIRACLMPHSYVFLGTAETTLNLDPGYKPEQIDKTTAYRIVT